MSVATADRLHSRLEQLADTTTIRLARIWLAAVASSDAEDVWFTNARPLVEAAATQAVGLTGAYARLSFPRAALAPMSDLIIPDAVARTQDPWGRVWLRLADGDPWDAATSSAEDVVAAVADDATLGVARDATTDQLRPLRVKWQRRLNAGACPWCMSMAQYTWDAAHEATFGHDRCRCLAVPSQEIGDSNQTVMDTAGWDKQAERRWKKRDQINRMKESESTALRRSREAGEAARREKDPARRERLEQREMDWETRAERAAEKRRVLETGSHRLAA